MMNNKEQAKQEMLRFMKQQQFLMDKTMKHLTLNRRRITEMRQVNLENNLLHADALC